MGFQKFTENFDHKKTGIKFPKVIGYTKNAIVETFERGMYINRLVSEEHDPQVLIFVVDLFDRSSFLLVFIFFFYFVFSTN